MFSNDTLSEAIFLQTSGSNAGAADMSQGVEGQMETEMCPAAPEGSCRICASSSFRKVNLS